MSYKKYVLFILLFLVLSSSLAWASKIKSKKTDNLHLLFVQEAYQGDLTPDFKHHGYYTLFLDSKHENIIYFTDQPVRKAGRLSRKQFIIFMKQRQYANKGNRPNIIVEGYLKHSNANTTKPRNYAFSIIGASYNKIQHSFDYRLWDIKHIGPKNSISLKDVNIFIDTMQSGFQPFPP